MALLKRYRDYIQALILALLCMVFCYFVYGFYYVEYEGLFDSFYSGKLTPGFQFRSIYFLGNVGISYAYSILYQYFNTIEWLSWIYAFYLLIACSLFFNIILHLLHKQLNGWVKLVFLLCIYSLIILDNNMHFIYTRVSYMMCASALATLIVFFQTKETVPKRPLLFFAIQVFFVLGTLTRVETSIATLLLMLTFAFLYLNSIKQILVLFAFPVLFVLVVSTAITIELNTSTEFHIQVEPEIEAQYAERNNTVPLSTRLTRKDSVIYMAAKSIMWSDPKVISPSYLRSLINKSNSYFTDIGQWKRACTEVVDIALTYKIHLLLIVFFFCIAVLSRTTKQYSIPRILFFEFSFWFLIVFQAYTIKVNDRSFGPYIAIFLFCHIIYFLQFCFNERYAKVLLVFVLLLTGFQLKNIQTESNILKAEFNRYQYASDKIRGTGKNKILVLNSTSCDYLFLSNKPFHPFNYTDFNRIYITDGFNMPFLPYYRPYLEKECQCNLYNFPSFWKFLLLHKENVIVLSTDERVKIIEDYVHEVYAFNLHFKKTSTDGFLKMNRSDSRQNWFDVNIFHITE